MKKGSLLIYLPLGCWCVVRATSTSPYMDSLSVPSSQHPYPPDPFRQDDMPSQSGSIDWIQQADVPPKSLSGNSITNEKPHLSKPPAANTAPRQSHLNAAPQPPNSPIFTNVAPQLPNSPILTSTNEAAILPASTNSTARHPPRTHIYRARSRANSKSYVLPRSFSPSKSLSPFDFYYQDKTSPDLDCPMFYSRIGRRCVVIASRGQMTWWDARHFCQSIRGDLITFRDVQDFVDFLEHVKVEDYQDMWIGGHEVGNEWLWITKDKMPRGTPYWLYDSDGNNDYSFEYPDRSEEETDAECIKNFYQYKRKPGVLCRCASMSWDNLYYLTPSACAYWRTPVCVFDGTLTPLIPQPV